MRGGVDHDIDPGELARPGLGVHGVSGDDVIQRTGDEAVGSGDQDRGRKRRRGTCGHHVMLAIPQDGSGRCREGPCSRTRVILGDEAGDPASQPIALSDSDMRVVGDIERPPGPTAMLGYHPRTRVVEPRRDGTTRTQVSPGIAVGRPTSEAAEANRLS